VRINSFIFTYTWRGDNIDKEIVEYIDPTGNGYIDIYNYTYDDRQNPFYELFAGGKTAGVAVSHLSENNITAITGLYYDEYNRRVEYNDFYEYLYNADFPTQRRYTYLSGSIEDVYGNTIPVLSTHTTFYEYK
jgi:hypothetical protein